MKLRARAIRAGISLILGGFSACASPVERAGTYFERADSAGIEVIRLVGAPTDTLLVDAPSVRIGAIGLTGDERDVFEGISDLALLSGGRIAVVDNRGRRVAVFDSTGMWLHDIGRQGEGPGEYGAPIYASVRNDTVFVWDALRRQLLRYSEEGEFLGSLALRAQTSSHPFAATGRGYILEVESGQFMDPAPALGALVRTTGEGTSADTIVGPYPVPERGWTITNEETGVGHITNPPALSVYPAWIANDGLLAWLEPQRATIEIRDLETGTLQRIVRLPYESGPPSATEQDAYFRGLQTAFGIPEEVMAGERESTQFVEWRAPVADLVADDSGRLWVAQHDPATIDRNYAGSDWDAIDLALDQMTRFRFPEGFGLVAIRGVLAFGVTTLASGVQVVDVFHLRGGP